MLHSSSHWTICTRLKFSHSIRSCLVQPRTIDNSRAWTLLLMQFSTWQLLRAECSFRMRERGWKLWKLYCVLLPHHDWRLLLLCHSWPGLGQFIRPQQVRLHTYFHKFTDMKRREYIPLLGWGQTQSEKSSMAFYTEKKNKHFSLFIKLNPTSATVRHSSWLLSWLFVAQYFFHSAKMRKMQNAWHFWHESEAFNYKVT